MNDKLAALQKEIKAKREEYCETAKLLLQHEFKRFFDTYPKLESFSWQQYTDYFNDGDTCYFHVHADPEWSLSINDQRHDNVEEEAEDSDYPEGEEPTSNNLTAAEWDTIASDISTLLYGIDSECLKDIYGDHVEIYVTRTNVNVTSYSDHD